LLGNKLFLLLTGLELVGTESYKYIYLVGFLPIVSVWSFLLVGAFSGMLSTPVVRDTMIISAIVYFIVIFSVTDFWGAYGIWIAYLFFALTRGFSLYFHMDCILYSLPYYE
jgi:hypothetical protein